MKYKLAICIATKNRVNYLSTLLTILADQLTDEVEVIIVDGRSNDGTSDLLNIFSSQMRTLKYLIQDDNYGLDGAYDTAVRNSSSEYCWLLGDDDEINSRSVSIILSEMKVEKDLYIVNSDVMDRNMRILLKKNNLGIIENKSFSKDELNKLFKAVSHYISYIGCVVIKTKVWLSRSPEDFYNTMFVHVGVIFRKELCGGAMLIAEPLIKIRYGNASWGNQYFKIWMKKWPEMIWSLQCLNSTSKIKATKRYPLNDIKILLLQRALYNINFGNYIVKCEEIGCPAIKAHQFILIFFPSWLLRYLFILLLNIIPNSSQTLMYDLKAVGFIKGTDH